MELPNLKLTSGSGSCDSPGCRTRFCGGHLALLNGPYDTLATHNPDNIIIKNKDH